MPVKVRGVIVESVILAIELNGRVEEEEQMGQEEG